MTTAREKSQRFNINPRDRITTVRPAIKRAMQKRHKAQDRRAKLKQHQFGDYMMQVGKDLDADGRKSLAKDYYAMSFALIKNKLAPEMQSYGTLYEYITWMEETLIPDLKASGYDSSAEDLENAISFFVHNNPAFKARGRSGNLVAKKATDEYGDARGKHVKLYNTEIVSLHADGTVTLRSGGYQTDTTMRRMNEVSKQWGLGFNVHQRKHQWFVSINGNEVMYSDGMNFNPTADVQKQGLLYDSPKGYVERFKQRFRKNPSQFLNNRQDIDWLFSTHLKRFPTWRSDTKSFGLEGNEDSPTSVMLYHKASPSVRDLPIATFEQNADGDLQLVKGAFKRNPDAKGRKMINLQEKRGAQWITLAMFRLDQKEFAKQVAKRFHRRHPGKALRLFS